MGERREEAVSPAHLQNLDCLKKRLLLLEPNLSHLDTTVESLTTAHSIIAAQKATLAQSPHALVTQNQQYLARLRVQLSAWRANARFLVEKHSGIAMFLDRTLSIQQNALITKLTKATLRDSGAVKVITAITLVYLPLTVVGVSAIARVAALIF